MSNWPGNLIRKTPVTPAGPFENGAAPGVWSLSEASYWTKQGLWPIAGNEQLFVEDVFSTYLYTGNGGAQTITNGIDLAGRGGMVWTKSRSGERNNGIIDTTRGITKWLSTNLLNGDSTYTTTITSVSSTGFAVGNDIDYNQNGTTMASWTFRKAPKFFDIVTYTGNGSTTYAHSLGVVPGVVMYKSTSGNGSWLTACRKSDGSYDVLVLNGTSGPIFSYANAADMGLTATTFNPNPAGAATVGTQFVAYLFAHDATADGVIQCGSYTGNGTTGNFVSLGWEPQWVMIKRATGGTGAWEIYDNMRGVPVSGSDYSLQPNSSGAEASGTNLIDFNATGFTLTNGGTNRNILGSDYIYIAIRRGPMRTPTLGTSVFRPGFLWDTSTSLQRWLGSVTDMNWTFARGSSTDRTVTTRLTGTGVLKTFQTNAETTDAAINWDSMFGSVTLSGSLNTTYVNYAFRRAPGFFDEVCYTGTGVATSFNHNLGVEPELLIVKNRTSTSSWLTYAKPLGNTKVLFVNLTSEALVQSQWNNTTPTSTQFFLGAGASNDSGAGYVAYLFASCPGVSKVGSYTGTGTTQTIDCGFTTGARFVLIKRAVGGTGNWLVWDSARGIIAGNDPYLALNDTNAEVTNTDYVDTDNSGFQLSSTAPSALNAAGDTYIFLAIA
jgi:hypothetical protein